MVLKIAESKKGPWIPVFDPDELASLGPEEMAGTGQLLLARGDGEARIGSANQLFSAIALDTLAQDEP